MSRNIRNLIASRGLTDRSLTENQKLITYSIAPDISNEEREDIIQLVKISFILSFFLSGKPADEGHDVTPDDFK